MKYLYNACDVAVLCACEYYNIYAYNMSLNDDLSSS